ncbi:DUF7144 family membrane protein [Kitasatospora sp. HPMI-4]|uniref:DUF7144 family membrane protein n=1 Tax=Kitasatospora sp. HPMI-4 TaxID=3448443 RepID=UPI003F1DF7D3
MAERPDARREHAETGTGGRITGPSMFAGIALSVSGPLSILLGVAGIAHDSLFSPAGYAYRFDPTSWGWVHLVVGVALSAAGVGVLADRSWGRWTGVAVAAISLITQFMFVPYYPVWSIILITLDLLIIWALSRFQAHPG